MPHTMVTFRLHRRGVILLILFGVVLAALIYVAGYLTAVYSRRPAAAPTPVVATPKAAPKAAPKKASAPAETPQPLTLRVDVLTSEEDAKARVASLAALGLKPSIEQLPTSSGIMLFNVQVGRYENRASAAAALKELQSRFGISAVIVPARASGNL